MNTAEDITEQKVHRLSVIIADVFSPERKNTTIGELVKALDHHGLAIILVLFSLPSALPVPAPGYSSILSIPLFLIAFHFLLQKDTLWLPDFLAKRSFEPAKYADLTPKLTGLVGFIERFTKPRWIAFARSRTTLLLIGILVFALACSMFLPIPGTNTAPAFGIFLIGFGLLEDDGIAIFVGMVAGILALCISLAVIIFGYEAVKLMVTSVRDFI